jgi:hypothetical protein
MGKGIMEVWGDCIKMLRLDIHPLMSLCHRLARIVLRAAEGKADKLRLMLLLLFNGCIH